MKQNYQRTNTHDRLLTLCRLICVAALLATGASASAQNDITMPRTGNDAANITPGTQYTVYDPGGTANYPSSCAGYLLLTSTSGMPIHLAGAFESERTYDKLYIYDGTSTSDPLIGTYDGTTTINVSTSSGFAYLYFKSDGSVNKQGFALSVCTLDAAGYIIDDITVSDITANTANIRWTDHSDGSSWTIRYGTDEANLNQTATSSATSVTLTGLNEHTRYYFFIYNNTTASEANATTCTSMGSDFQTTCPESQNCVNFTDLDNCHTVCTYGTFRNPALNTGKVDNGSTNMSSRHTVYYDTTAIDTRTTRNGESLRIVPPGESASVRLGNWSSGSQAESITYEYNVDTAQHDLLVLKYAAVLQNPGHSRADQPSFEFTITDEYGVEVNPICNSAVFVPGYTSTAWKTGASSNVQWKDWTTVGVDLTPLHGQTIRVTLTTRDCSQSAHYGYAYFVLKCDKKALTSSQCGNTVENTFTAPDGFSYKWYDTDDPNTILSTTASVHVYELGTYNCILSFAGGTSATEQCSFTMTAVAGPRFPFARYTYHMGDTTNCNTLVSFENNSVITTDYAHTDLTGQSCETYDWIIDDSIHYSDANPSHYFPEGWHTVQLAAMIANGGCADTLTQRFFVEGYCQVWDTLRYTFCDSGEVRFFDTLLTSAGTWTHDSLNHHHTVIIDMPVSTSHSIRDTVTENDLASYSFNGLTFTTDVADTLFRLVNAAGCDSLLSYSLYVCRNHDTTLNRTICDDALPLSWIGYTFTQADTQTYLYPSHCGADSSITLQLHVNPTYLLSYFDTICDSETLPWSDTVLTSAGLHILPHLTAAGCDSTEQVSLTMLATTYRTYPDTVIENMMPHTFNGKLFSTDIGDTLFRLVNVAGCDSLLSYSLYVCRNYDTALTRAICESLLPVQWGEGYFEHADTQHFDYLNRCGADSSITLTLITYPVYSRDIDAEICDNQYYHRGGHTFRQSGHYQLDYLTINKCDSVEYLHLTVHPTYNRTDSVTICHGDTLLWADGNVYRAETSMPIVSVLSSHGCDSTLRLRLTILPAIRAQIAGSPSSVTYDQPLITLYDNSRNATSRTWILPGGNTEYDQEVTFLYPVEQAQASVVLIASNELGCYDTAMRSFTMEREGIWMPNLFTPDKEENNRLKISGIDLNEIEAKIYSRTGLLVFTYHSLDDEWDGTYNGQPCQQGTYVYVIHYTSVHNPKSWLTKKGTVILLR